MHINVRKGCADLCGVAVNLFVVNVVLKVFEKKRDSFCGLVSGITGGDVGIGQIFIGDKGLDRRIVKFLNA